jgi:AbiV family abortive infection protein
MQRKLNSYKGNLTPSQVADGINAARHNAIRLLTDAKILLNIGKYPSAAALSILSIEESGKTHILRLLALSKTDEDSSKVWREYRSHIKKNVLWSFPEAINKGARKLDDFRPIFDQTSEHPYLLDQLKQISIYTDCLGEAHWSEPNLVIDKELAVSLVSIAEVLTSTTEVTTTEIELWVKNLRDVDFSDLSKSKEALLHWYYDMQASGLLPEGYRMKEILDFLGFNLGLVKD